MPKPDKQDAPTATPAPKPKPKPKATPPTPRSTEVLYPEVTVNGVVIPRANLTITAERMKELLGWEELEGQVFFNGEAPNWDAIRMRHNVGNRPFDGPHCEALAQDILNHNYKFNRETIIIGETGRVLSGQHRGPALMLAKAMWEHPVMGHHWKKLWETEPTIESLVAFGGSEDAETIRTIDTAESRTYSDVLYTQGIFKDREPKDRERMTRLLAASVKTLWERTGEKNDPWSPDRTHSESDEFLKRHMRLIDAVTFLWSLRGDFDDKDSHISRLVISGSAAAYLYLMASSKSDVEKYRDAKVRSEKLLDWSLWDEACEYWKHVRNNMALRHALAGMVTDGTSSERTAILVKGWLAMLDHEEITDEDLHMKYLVEFADTPDGKPQTDVVITGCRASIIAKNPQVTGLYLKGGCPLIGGIDAALEEQEADANTGDEPAPEPKTLKDRATAEKAASEKARKDAIHKSNVAKLGGKSSGNGTTEGLTEAGKAAAADAADEARLKAQWAEYKQRQPGCLLLFRKSTGHYAAYYEDAPIVGEVLGVTVRNGTCLFADTKLEVYLRELLSAGHRVAICEEVDGQPVVKPVVVNTLTPVVPTMPVKKPIPKPMKRPAPKSKAAAKK